MIGATRDLESWLAERCGNEGRPTAVAHLPAARETQSRRGRRGAEMLGTDWDVAHDRQRRLSRNGHVARGDRDNSWTAARWLLKRRHPTPVRPRSPAGAQAAGGWSWAATAKSAHFGGCPLADPFSRGSQHRIAGEVVSAGAVPAAPSERLFDLNYIWQICGGECSGQTLAVESSAASAERACGLRQQGPLGQRAARA